jgi:hypothetical protein
LLATARHQLKLQTIHSSAHAADDALTRLRIHRRALNKARASCKMVCPAGKKCHCDLQVIPLRNGKDFFWRNDLNLMSDKVRFA